MNPQEDLFVNDFPEFMKREKNYIAKKPDTLQAIQIIKIKKR
jgi:hypothetical protein